jgi:hypothetical protein
VQPVPLSLTARTLYAELRELALAIGSVEHMGDSPGSIVAKTLASGTYLYRQYRDLDGRTRQSYLGPDNERTRALAERWATRAATTADDMVRLNELRAAFVGAGGGVMEHAPLRVLKGFADAGLLQPGVRRAVLVGTHAFNVIGNLLGVRWSSQMQTQDVDLAGNADIDIAVGNPTASAPDVLQQLDMGFIPVPTLNPRSPSTSFRVRGQELRVDLLVPLTGMPSARPMFIPALNAMGQPLRFLDYLLVDPVPAVATGRRALVLLSVPSPERFALHKLLVSESRSAAFAVKAGKDREQAMQMLAALIEHAPDGVAAAKADLIARGAGWSGKLARALKKAQRTYPEAADFVESLK